MAEASPSASIRRLAASAAASTSILALSALAGASRAARRSASIALGLGQGGLGAGDVLGLQHGGLGLHLAGLAHLVGLGLLHLQGGLRGGHVGPGQVLAFDRPGVGIGQFDAHLTLGVLDLALLLEGRRLLAHLLLPVRARPP